ncbi:MAG: Ig-like domain-containing protein, partial [Gammaproteobacteria bacterium]|nr:Ig-like domain-containing protein [Gammaproteobacteria bacterium]
MKFSRYLVKALVLAGFLGLSACENGVDGGGSIGGGAGATDSTVVVSGKVSLLGGSSVSTSQKLTTAQKLSKMTSVPQGRLGSRTYMKSRQTVQKTSSGGDFLRAASFIDNATVYLYDAEHPEWLYPVAESSTDSSGNYLLQRLKNSLRNLDAAGNPVYSDGDYIPEGNYTLLAFKAGGFDPILGITTDPIVAVQTVVNTFSGTVSAADLAAQSSTVRPKIDTILGLKKNTDGTQVWGSTATNTVTLPANAAIPVTFSMAMSRASVMNGIEVVNVTDAGTVVAGEWKVSADWLTAVFHPTADLNPGDVYRVTVSGS